MNAPSTLSIGELARRTGLSVSAIRYYEARGLVRAIRSAGNQRRFLRSDIRRLSFALIAQQLGLTLSEIEAELSMLPRGQAPTLAEWRAIGTRMRGALAATGMPQIEVAGHDHIRAAINSQFEKFVVRGVTAGGDALANRHQLRCVNIRRTVSR